LLEQKRTRSRWSEILTLLIGVLHHERGTTGQQVAREWLTELTGLRHMPGEGDPGWLALQLAILALRELPDQSALVPVIAETARIWFSHVIGYAQIHDYDAVNRLTEIGQLLWSVPNMQIALLEDQLPLFADARPDIRWAAIRTLGAHAEIALLTPHL